MTLFILFRSRPDLSGVRRCPLGGPRKFCLKSFTSLAVFNQQDMGVLSCIWQSAHPALLSFGLTCCWWFVEH